MLTKELIIRIKRIEMMMDLEPIPGVDEETVAERMSVLQCGMDTAIKLCKEEAIKAWFRKEMGL